MTQEELANEGLPQSDAAAASRAATAADPAAEAALASRAAAADSPAEGALASSAADSAAEAIAKLIEHVEPFDFKVTHCNIVGETLSRSVFGEGPQDGWQWPIKKLTGKKVDDKIFPDMQVRVTRDGELDRGRPRWPY